MGINHDTMLRGILLHVVCWMTTIGKAWVTCPYLEISWLLWKRDSTGLWAFACSNRTLTFISLGEGICLEPALYWLKCLVFHQSATSYSNWFSHLYVRLPVFLFCLSASLFLYTMDSSLPKLTFILSCFLQMSQMISVQNHVSNENSQKTS